MLRRRILSHFHHLLERCWFLLRWKSKWRRSASGERSESVRVPGVGCERVDIFEVWAGIWKFKDCWLGFTVMVTRFSCMKAWQVRLGLDH